MKVDTMARAQMAQHQNPPPYNPSAPPRATTGHVYPALADYMGLELSHDVIARNMPEYQVQTVSNYAYFSNEYQIYAIV